jgi:hypothetical protein
LALTASQIIALACEAAHSPRKTSQAQLFYNSILSDLCQERDFAEARGQYLFNFTFQPGSSSVPTPVGGGGTVTPGGGGVDTPGGGGTSGSGLVGTFSAAGGGIESPGGGGTEGPGGGGTGTPGGGGSPTPPTPPTPTHTPGGLPPFPGNQFGSGPIVLPLDYLRLSGSSGSAGAQRSFVWWLNGVPYPVIPMDLAEFDMQVQQSGLQSFVWMAATDMAAPIDDRILLKTTGNVTVGSTQMTNVASTTRLVGGSVLGVAGQGIVPGTMLVSLAGGGGGGSGGSSPGGGGTDSPGGGGTDTPGGGGGGGGVGTLTLSQPANATIAGASVFFGYPPIVYVYPPPESALQAMIRYQKQMPDVVDFTRIPWFRNDGYMLEKLTGKLCMLNDDTRAGMMLGGPDIQGSAEQKLSLFLSMKDDEQSHPKRVELDRRYFGRGIGNLRTTKRVGW